MVVALRKLAICFPLAVATWSVSACQVGAASAPHTVSLRVQGNVPDAQVTIDDQAVGVLAFVASRGVALPPDVTASPSKRRAISPGMPWSRPPANRCIYRSPSFPSRIDHMARVALNIDLGEFPDEPEELYALATVVNVACGGHAGDERSMKHAVDLAVRHGTLIAAHPSYPDRPHFGRARMAIPLDELYE